jgi:hypothetical protein
MSWRLRVVGCAFVCATAGPALAQTESPAGEPNAAGDTTAAAPDAGAPAEAQGPPIPSSIPEEKDRPFRNILPNFWNDLRRLPSAQTAVVLGVGGLLSAVAYQNDEYFTTQAAAGGTDQIFAVGDQVGEAYTQAGIALGTFVVGRLAKQEKVAHVGSDLIRAQLLTAVLTHALKAVTSRERPTGERDGSTQTYSFPSGHASASFTTATVLWRHLGWKVGLPASTLAAYASASRIQQNAHYVSDILFGAALGIASARTVTIGHGERRVAVAPVPITGGAALTFTVLAR